MFLHCSPVQNHRFFCRSPSHHGDEQSELVEENRTFVFKAISHIHTWNWRIFPILGGRKSHKKTAKHTVDGRHPAPVDMENIPIFIGFHKITDGAGFLPSTGWWIWVDSLIHTVFFFGKYSTKEVVGLRFEETYLNYKPLVVNVQFMIIWGYPGVVIWATENIGQLESVYQLLCSSKHRKDHLEEMEQN